VPDLREARLLKCVETVEHPLDRADRQRLLGRLSSELLPGLDPHSRLPWRSLCVLRRAGVFPEAASGDLRRFVRHACRSCRR